MRPTSSRANLLSASWLALAALHLGACGHDTQDRFEATGTTRNHRSVALVETPTCKSGEIAVSGTLDGTRIAAKARISAPAYRDPGTDPATGEPTLGTVIQNLSDERGAITFTFNEPIAEGKTLAVRASLRLYRGVRLDVGNCKANETPSRLSFSEDSTRTGTFSLNSLRTLVASDCDGPLLEGSLQGCFADE